MSYVPGKGEKGAYLIFVKGLKNCRFSPSGGKGEIVIRGRKRRERDLVEFTSRQRPRLIEEEKGNQKTHRSLAKMGEDGKERSRLCVEGEVGIDHSIQKGGEEDGPKLQC